MPICELSDVYDRLSYISFYPSHIKFHIRICHSGITAKISTISSEGSKKYFNLKRISIILSRIDKTSSFGYSNYPTNSKKKKKKRKEKAKAFLMSCLTSQDSAPIKRQTPSKPICRESNRS